MGFLRTSNGFELATAGYNRQAMLASIIGDHGKGIVGQVGFIGPVVRDVAILKQLLRDRHGLFWVELQRDRGRLLHQRGVERRWRCLGLVLLDVLFDQERFHCRRAFRLASDFALGITSGPLSRPVRRKRCLHRKT